MTERCLYADTTVELVDDAVCIRFYATEGDPVELWIPVISAATAGLALLEEAMGRSGANRVMSKLELDGPRSAWTEPGAT